MYKWRGEVSAAAGQTAVISIPHHVQDVTVTVIPGEGGTATCHHTLSSREQIVSNPAFADWVSWDAGTVDVATTRACIGTVTALRLVANTAAARLQVLAR